ncbi:hypothetical protein ACHAWF_011618 [Thalassiosira exigua]
MQELPSYCHLSPAEVERLSFHVTVRCVRNGGDRNSLENEDAAPKQSTSKEIAWQERLAKPSDPGGEGLQLFTYTNADIIPFEATVGTKRDQRGSRGFSLRSEAKGSRAEELFDRLQREDQCQIMTIMATDSPNRDQDEVLCIIKLFESGLVSACPAFSQVEHEDCDETGVFISNEGIDEVIDKGPRLTTYTFCMGGSVYEYAIECHAAQSVVDGAELMALPSELFDRSPMVEDGEAIEERRREIREKFESFDCMYEKEAEWDRQACIEIVSAEGFAQTNLLLSGLNGSRLAVRYGVLGRNEPSKTDEVVLKGATASVNSHSNVRENLEFCSRFAVAFISIAFALMLALEDNGRDFLRTILVLIFPLALLVKAGVHGDASPVHINHQLSLLYNELQSSQESASPQKLELELRAYFHHNFGVTSLAGCGVAALPSDPGQYDVEVPTWRPISCSTAVGETRSRLYDHYLGSCLSDIGPQDPVPFSDGEDELTKGTDVRLVSKGGLLTDGSGSIRVRVNVAANHFDKKGRDARPKAEEAPLQQRVKMRETVDEILARVRRNKRGRMARVIRSDPSAAEGSGTLQRPVADTSAAKNNSRFGQEGDNAVDGNVSGRTVEVLERLRRARRNQQENQKS